MSPALRLLLVLPLLAAGGGCNVSQSLENAAKKIQLNTPEPIKVDMKITLDVYQHEAAGGGKAKEVEAVPADLAEVNRRKFNRQQEIQELKNNRYVAETHRGLLYLRDQPAGTYGGYVKKTVEDENADRKSLMLEEAAKQKRELHDIEKERHEAAVHAAFAGEYIEVPDPAKPGAWKIVQKVK